MIQWIEWYLLITKLNIHIVSLFAVHSSHERKPHLGSWLIPLEIMVEYSKGVTANSERKQVIIEKSKSSIISLVFKVLN